MRRLILATIFVLAGLSPSLAQDLPETVRIGGQYTSLGYCQLTSLASATLISTCSGGIPTGSRFAEMCTDTVALRYRDDLTNPTATVGMPVTASTCFQYAGPLTAFSVIQQAASGILNITFYK